MRKSLFLVAAAAGVGVLMAAPSTASAGGTCGYAVPAYTYAYTYTTCCTQVTCGYTYPSYRTGYVYPNYVYTYPTYAYPRRAARRAWRRGY